MNQSRDLVLQEEVVIKSTSCWLKYNGMKTLNTLAIVIGSVVVLTNLIKRQYEIYR